jgi:uncharacterized protein
MHSLNVPVQRLREGPLAIDVDLPPAELDLADDEFEFRGTVRGHVTYTLVGHDVIATGELAVMVATRCVRCLAPVQMRLRAAVNEVWLPHDPAAEQRPDADEEGIEALVYAYRDDLIEPAEVFRELLLVELPKKPLCSPDCKGLCPGCGVDLNHETCRCRPEEEPEPEAPLPDWKRKLKDLNL